MSYTQSVSKIPLLRTISQSQSSDSFRNSIGNTLSVGLEESIDVGELSPTAGVLPTAPNFQPYESQVPGGTYIDYFLPTFDTFIFHHLGTAEAIGGAGSEYYQGITGRATGEDRWYAIPTPGAAPVGASFSTTTSGVGNFAITGGQIPKSAHSLPIGLINMWTDTDENTPNLSGLTIAPRTPTRVIMAFDLSSLGKTYSIGPTKLYITLEDHNAWNTNGG